MKLILRRSEYKDDVTLGELLQDNKHLCYTLEEPWKDNKRGISCIPTGNYICRPHDGSKFKDVWQICNVKDRTAILIHTGNTTADIEGCVLVGLVKGRDPKKPSVLQSKAALKLLKDFIGRDKNGKLNIFFLEII